MLFMIGDYLAGAAVGVVTALAVRGVVWPGMDMVMAMLIGMGLGMVVHLIMGLLMGPLVGMFNAMIPASTIGMYGGMIFAMRDSMAAGSRSLGAALMVGAVFGLIVVAALNYYDWSLHGTVVDSGDSIEV
jgi:hypothetical protein